MANLLLYFLGLSFCLLSMTAHADDMDGYRKHYTLDVLLSHSSDFFDVYADADDIDPVGSFYGNENNSVTLALNLPYRYFDSGSFGYYIHYRLNRFTLDKQDTTITSSDVHEMDLGTSVTGYNAYATISGFYNFGNRVIEKSNDSAFKIGLGAGLGYLKADGDIILTELPTQPKVAINISSIGFNYGIFLDYRYGPWVFRLDTFGTSVKKDGYSFEDISQSFQVGYAFRL